MISPNFGAIHQPKIVRNILGLTTDRTALRSYVKNSAVLFMGSFVSDVTDNGATPTAVSGGVKAFSGANDLVLGFVTGMVKNGNVPLFEDGKYKGTIANAAAELPVKYTFTATNDYTNATPDAEFVEVTPIWDGDILEVPLFSAGTTSVPRGTTAASSTIGSSFPINTTNTFALTEASVVAAGSTLTGVQFRTVLLDGQQPQNPNHVFVMCIRSSMTWRCSA